MASTRSKNDRGDYKLEQKSLQKRSEHVMYPYRRVAYDNALPAAGINVGHMPSNQLSNNAIDIESRLFGINTNNMVNPQKPVIPELNTHRNLEFFDRQAVLMPEALVVEKDQRPLPKP